MFMVDHDRLVEGLENLRRRLCAYGPDAQRCDCKFGVPERPGIGEQSGCCELQQAIELLVAAEEGRYP